MSNLPEHPNHAQKTDRFVREYFNALQVAKGDQNVKFLDGLRTTNNLYVITENYNVASLQDKFKSKEKIPIEEACKVIKQISQGLMGCGETIHGDLKPENVLYNEGKVKVKDLQFIKLMNEARGHENRSLSLMGAGCYSAPEVLNSEGMTEKSDVWAAGIMFYEMIFGMKPWSGQSVQQLYMNYKTKPVNFPEGVSEDLRDLLDRMLEFEGEKRISWEEVYNHNALKEWKEVVRTPIGSSWSEMNRPEREVVVFGRPPKN